MKTINLGKYIPEIEETLKNKINDKLFDLLSDVIQESPVDKGVYLKGNKIKKATKEGNIIRGEVYNDSIEAENVEYGWKQTPVNWHKNRRKGGPVIFTGVGARVFTRIYDKRKMEISEFLKKIKLIK